MTEAQLRVFPAFQALPIYDESDERADSITAIRDHTPYRKVRECSTLRDIEECLKNAQFVPLGALRAVNTDGPIVVAYFGEKS